MNTAPIISKAWSFCTTLRDDDVSYGDYLEQLTYLTFLKMADESVGWVRCATISYLPLIESVGAHRNPTTELNIYGKCWVTVHTCL